jgi:hypothetical protein
LRRITASRGRAGASPVGADGTGSTVVSLTVGL